MSKNTRNRILLTAVAALLLVAVAVGGTMAWLMDTSATVTNEFTGSKVEVNLTETTGSSYQIIPGGTDKKDPEAWIMADSEPAYLFVLIKEEDNFFYVVEEEVGTPYKLVDFDLDDGWTVLASASTAENAIDTDPFITVIYREVTEAQVGTHYGIIKEDTIRYSEYISNGDLNGTGVTLPKITFTPYAIQSANMDSYTIDQLWNMAKTAPAN